MSVKTWLIAGLLAIAVPAAAQQTPATASQQPDNAQATGERGRVAVTTDGDAGLWWVPLADTNGKGRTRGSVQRNSFNTPQGQMNVANFTANVSFGLAERIAVAYARHLPLRMTDPPLPIPDFTIALFWHDRVEADPALAWFRSLLLEVTSSAGGVVPRSGSRGVGPPTPKPPERAVASKLPARARRSRK